jgi:hypothetical protein
MPLALKVSATALDLTEEVVDGIGDDEVLFRVKARGLLDIGDLFSAKCSAMGFGVTGDLAANTNSRLDIDKDGFAAVTRAGRDKGGDDGLDIIVSVGDLEHLPPRRSHLGVDILRIGEVD